MLNTTYKLKNSVGKGGRNFPNDVGEVQKLLVKHECYSGRIDKSYGPLTEGAIKKFQQKFMRIPDVLIVPNGKTWQYLTNEKAIGGETTKAPYKLNGSVGKGGKNLPRDVEEVQRLLAERNHYSGRIDRHCGSFTEGAIKSFQSGFMKNPDALIEPNGKTWKYLTGQKAMGPKPSVAPSATVIAPVVLAPAAPAPANANRLSGAHWHARFPQSIQTSALVEPFRGNVERFISALRNAGANVRITTTYRPPERAHLMHYSPRVASGNIRPQNVPAMEGVDIEWVHRDTQGQPDLTRSRNAARAMEVAYGLDHPAVLNSLHIVRRAIDMYVTNYINRTVNNAQGQGVLLRSQRDLYNLGRTYGVIKLITTPPDEPHWSDNGR